MASPLELSAGWYLYKELDWNARRKTAHDEEFIAK
jgi:hypothetical protein